MALLELREARASAGGRRILESLSLSVGPGEVHALLGERRAGKSAIARLLAGAARLEGGEILVGGRPAEWKGPRSSLRAGIGVLYQEPSLVPSLDAAENILAGRKRIGLGGGAARREAEAYLGAFASRWGLAPDPRVPARRLGRLEASVVELARALAPDPAIIVLDEPAGRFTAEEMQVLFGLVAEAKAAGKAVLYAATTVDEVFRAADRVSIVRAGRIASSLEVRSLDRERLVDLAYAFTESREELLRKNLELMKYRRYGEQLISRLPLGSVILDPEGRVYLANRAARAALGAGEGDGDLGSLLARVPAGDRAEIAAAAREGRPGSWPRVPAEGGRTLRMLAFPFSDEDGRGLGTILSVEDVSEELATREYLVRAERSSSIAALAAGVAHEVNNPLAIISNYVELLLMRPQEPYTAERLGIVRGEIRRIQGIVSSLLSFSAIGSSCVEDTDLSEVASQCLALLEHEAELRGARIEGELPSARVVARADPSRIKQVIVNLALNAIEAAPKGETPEGGAARIGRVALRLRAEGGAALLEVEDDGPGLPEAVLDGLFKPFVTEGKGSSHSGLGLSVCKHIVEAHGGSIDCESRPGRTVFAVRLPLAGPPSPER